MEPANVFRMGSILVTLLAVVLFALFPCGLVQAGHMLFQRWQHDCGIAIGFITDYYTMARP